MTPRTLQMVLSAAAIKIHWLKTAGAWYLLLKCLIEVLLRADTMSKASATAASLLLRVSIFKKQMLGGWEVEMSLPLFLLLLLLKLTSNYIQCLCTPSVI